MDNKQLWMTVVVAAVVAVVASVVTASFVDSPLLAPRGGGGERGSGGGSGSGGGGSGGGTGGSGGGGGGSLLVNAHECTADSVCEMINAIVKHDIEASGGLFVGDVDPTAITDGSLFVENNANIGGRIHASDGSFNNLIVDDGNLAVEGTSELAGNAVTPRLDIKSSGTGNIVGYMAHLGLVAGNDLAIGASGNRSLKFFTQDGSTLVLELDKGEAEVQNLLISPEGIITHGSWQAPDGSSPAFVCVDNTGVLFRSPAPCA